MQNIELIKSNGVMGIALGKDKLQGSSLYAFSDWRTTKKKPLFYIQRL